MVRFHIVIHAAPDRLPEVVAHELDGRRLDVVPIEPTTLAGPLPVSFEQAVAELERLPRMFVEPDGSFVWVAGDGPAAWQIDGLLVDRGGRLLWCELKGFCPGPQLDAILRACGWPTTQVVIQLVREAVFLTEPAFRRWAGLTD